MARATKAAASKATRAKREAEAAPASEVVAPRKRRTAEDARAAILDAAERRLVTSGPAGIRLQEVAADVGVSHPTVLHHFGSREALVREVCRRAFAAILDDLVAATAASEGGAEQMVTLLESTAGAMRHNGHGRVFFWLALENLLVGHEGPQLLALGLAAHELRLRRRADKRATLDDTRHTVALASLALLAESVIGPKIFADLGLGDDEGAGQRFHTWLGRLLVDHLDHGPR